MGSSANKRKKIFIFRFHQRVDNPCRCGISMSGRSLRIAKQRSAFDDRIVKPVTILRRPYTAALARYRFYVHNNKFGTEPWCPPHKSKLTIMSTYAHVTVTMDTSLGQQTDCWQTQIGIEAYYIVFGFRSVFEVWYRKIDFKVKVNHKN